MNYSNDLEVTSLVNRLPSKKLRDIIEEMIDTERVFQVLRSVETESSPSKTMKSFWTFALEENTKEEIMSFDDSRLRVYLATRMAAEKVVKELYQKNSSPNGRVVTSLFLKEDILEKHSLSLIS